MGKLWKVLYISICVYEFTELSISKKRTVNNKRLAKSYLSVIEAKEGKRFKVMVFTL